MNPKKPPSQKTQTNPSSSSNSSEQHSPTPSSPSHPYYPSEQATNLYDPIMKSIPGMGMDVDLEFWKEKLSAKGICYRNDYGQRMFMKYCLKNDWESTIYQVRYGHFQSTIKMMVVNLDPKIFGHPPINKGNFGQVFLFHQPHKSSALKNIKIPIDKSTILDKALTEIFLSKILSALEIGPQFYNIFSYDAILYKNYLQYAMEFCDVRFWKFYQPAGECDLMRDLRVMHGFNICHYDIKLDNIGWSYNLNKFVFLDFGLTEILAQPQGYKTKTKFKGTYGYCSPEMKKLHYTKTSSYIDSYYNDLHCLKFALAQLGKSKVQTRFFKPQETSGFLPKMPYQPEDFQQIQLSKQSGRQVHIKQNEALIRFFALKLSIFEQDYESVQKLIANQTLLIQTFRKIISLEKQNSANGSFFEKVYQKIFQKSQQIRQKLSLMSELDAVLFEYCLKNQQKSKLVSTNRKFQQISQSPQIFDTQWKNNKQKQTIFTLIDVYHNNDEGLRSKLVEKIYDKICGGREKTGEKVSEMMKMREILLYYFQYFLGKKDTVYMERILVYFQMMNDQYNAERMKQQILDIHLEKEKYMQYLADSFKFFIGNFLTVHRKQPFKPNKHLQPLLTPTPNSPIPFPIAPTMSTPFTTLIQTLQPFLHIYTICPQTSRHLKQQIALFMQKYGEYFPAEMENVLNVVVDMRCPFSGKFIGVEEACFGDFGGFWQQGRFGCLYLEKCCLRMRMLNLYYYQRVHTLTQLLNSQPFLKNFQTTHHLPTLSSSSPTQKHQKHQIAQDYLQIHSHPSPLTIIDQDYLMALDLIYPSKQQIQRIIIEYYRNWRLDAIDGYEMLANFYVGLQSVFSYFFKSSQNFGNLLSQEFVEFLCEVFGGFMQYSTKLLQQPTILQPQPQSSYLLTKPILQTSKTYLKIFLNLLQNNATESLNTLQQILTTRKELCWESVFLSSLCAIQERARHGDKDRVRGVMVGLGGVLEREMRFQAFPIVPQFLQKILQTLISTPTPPSSSSPSPSPQTSPITKTSHYLQSIFKYLHKQKLPLFRYSYLLQIIEQFLYENFTVEQCWQFVVGEVGRQLREFSDCGKFLYVVGVAWGRVMGKGNFGMERENIGNARSTEMGDIGGRVVRICCFYMPALSQGWFRTYKTQFLRNTAQKYQKCHYILYPNRRSKFSSIKKLQNHINKDFAIKRHSQKYSIALLSPICDVREKMKEKCGRLEEMLREV